MSSNGFGSFAIWVRRIPWEINEHELAAWLQRNGASVFDGCYGVYFAYNVFGNSVGGCHVLLNSEDDVHRSLELNDVPICGDLHLEIEPSSMREMENCHAEYRREPNETIMKIRGLPPQATEKDIRNYFDGYNVLEIVWCRIYPKRRSRDAFVRLGSKAEVKQAFEMQQHKMLLGKPMEIGLGSRCMLDKYGKLNFLESACNGYESEASGGSGQKGGCSRGAAGDGGRDDFDHENNGYGRGGKYTGASCFRGGTNTFAGGSSRCNDDDAVYTRGDQRRGGYGRGKGEGSRDYFNASFGGFTNLPPGGYGGGERYTNETQRGGFNTTIVNRKPTARSSAASCSSSALSSLAAAKRPARPAPNSTSGGLKGNDVMAQPEKVDEMAGPSNSAKALLKNCELVQSDKNPNIFLIKPHELVHNKTTDIGQYEIRGESKVKKTAADEKVIMMVGATGSGKSTLINGMVNYLFGVKWTDDFRLRLINDSDKIQAFSQTQTISSYTIFPDPDMPISYPLTIIDTPGFGNTAGITRDDLITDHIRQFFSTSGSHAIDHVDAIGFVTPASTPRLTPTQQYVFDSILSIFGKDIGENIFLMITFSDGQEPPVLSVIEAADIRYQHSHKFNNSALYAEVKGKQSLSFDYMFWQMGESSMKEFFTHFATTTAKSLVLTKEVLQERNSLQAAMAGFSVRIQQGMTSMDTLMQPRTAIDNNQAKVNDNKKFTIEVDEPQVKKIDMVPNTSVSVCVGCHFTCHYPCGTPKDADKAGCAAMNPQGTCNVCPGKCHWSQHHNLPYRFELYTVKKTKTFDQVKKLYDIALNERNSVQKLLHRLELDMKGRAAALFELLEQMRNSIARLDEIALRPNPLSTVEYIDVLIESEKMQGKPGFQRRVEALYKARVQAECLNQIRDPDFVPFPEYLPGQQQPKSGKSAGGKTWWSIR